PIYVQQGAGYSTCVPLSFSRSCSPCSNFNSKSWSLPSRPNAVDQTLAATVATTLQVHLAVATRSVTASAAHALEVSLSASGFLFPSKSPFRIISDKACFPSSQCHPRSGRTRKAYLDLCHYRALH